MISEYISPYAIVIPFCRLLAIIVFISAFSCNGQRPKLYNAQLNCKVRHLKSEKKMAADFPEFEITDEVDDCETFLSDKKKEIYRRTYLQCLEDDSKEHDAIDYMYLTEIYESLDTKLANIKWDKYNKLSRETADEAENRCLTHHFYGAFFDNIMNESFDYDSPSVRKSRYCLRKLAVSKRLLDPSYSIVVNPDHLDESSIRCNIVLKDIFQQVREKYVVLFSNKKFDFSKKKVQCITNKFREERYLAKYMSLVVLQSLNLSSEQKATERQNFISFMNEVVSAIGDCND